MFELLTKINKFTNQFFNDAFELELSAKNDINKHIQFTYSTIMKLLIMIEESGVKLTKSQIAILLKNFQSKFIILDTKLSDIQNTLYNYSLEIEYEVQDGKIYIYSLDDILQQTIAVSLDVFLSKYSINEYFIPIQDVKLFLMIVLMSTDLDSVEELYDLVDSSTQELCAIEYKLIMDFNNNPSASQLLDLLNINIDLNTQFLYTIKGKLYLITIRNL